MYRRSAPEPFESRDPVDPAYPGLTPLSADMVVYAKVGQLQLERLLTRHAEFGQYLAANGQPPEFS